MKEEPEDICPANVTTTEAQLGVVYQQPKSKACSLYGFFICGCLTFYADISLHHCPQGLNLRALQHIVSHQEARMHAAVVSGREYAPPPGDHKGNSSTQMLKIENRPSSPLSLPGNTTLPSYFLWGFSS